MIHIPDLSNQELLNALSSAIKGNISIDYTSRGKSLEKELCLMIDEKPLAYFGCIGSEEAKSAIFSVALMLQNSDKIISLLEKAAHRL